MDLEYRKVQSTKGQEDVQNAGGNRMYYDYHPWISKIEEIEYHMKDFLHIYLIYGMVGMIGLYLWDKAMYERYLNE